MIALSLIYKSLHCALVCLKFGKWFIILVDH